MGTRLVTMELINTSNNTVPGRQGYTLLELVKRCPLLCRTKGQWLSIADGPNRGLLDCWFTAS